MRFAGEVACLLGLALGSAWALPAAGAAREVPVLRAGAIEVGLSGAVTSVEGSTRADGVLRAGTFVGAGPGLAGFEVGVTYSHVGSLDLFGVEGGLTWQPSLGGTAAQPFLGVGAGLRQEWLGSFSDVRYPVGLALGLRLLVTQAAALRAEYRVMRVLNDPVADHTEQQALAGLVLLFRNRD